MEKITDDIVLYNDIEAKVKNMDLSNLVIITDFDFTLTHRFNNQKSTTTTPFDYFSSFCVVEQWEQLSQKYRDQRVQDFAFYSPKEHDLSLSVEERRAFCDEWTTRELISLSAEKISRKDFSSMVEKVVTDGKLVIRSKAEKVFDFADEHDVPVYVLSAGLGEVILPFLERVVPGYGRLKGKGLVTVVSNFLEYDDDGFSVGFRQPCLNTFTKTDHLKLAFKHDNRDAVVFGDHHHDSLCVEKLTLNNHASIAFVNYEKQYMLEKKKEQMERYAAHWDAVCFNESSFDYHLKLLSMINKKDSSNSNNDDQSNSNNK